MYYKKICVALIAFTIIHSTAYAKKTKKNKRPSYENEESTPQPKVISYSTFGFNDVASYDGFVPSSSEYANYVNGENQESTTRLYAPAFPTALESIGYGNNNYETQPVHEQLYNLDQNEGHQLNVLQYPQNIKHFFNQSPQNNYNIMAHDQESPGINEDHTNYPLYGAKLNYKDKSKSKQFNKTEINTVYNSGYLGSSDDKYFNLPETQTTYDTKPKYGESNFKYENLPNNIVTYPSSGIENFVTPVTEVTHNLPDYPRIVDFTKMMQIHYPSATENVATTTISTILKENSYINSNTDHSNKVPKKISLYDDTYDSDRNQGSITKNIYKLHEQGDQEFSYSYSTSHNKNNATEIKPNSEYKKKSRNKHWIQNKNHTNNFKDWRDASSLTGYEYPTNDNNKSFNNVHQANRDHTKTNFGEIPDSTNIIDFAKYQFSDNDFSNFKKMPEFSYGVNNYNNILPTKSILNNYVNPYKHLIDTTSTATSYWGNVYKPNNEYLSFQTPLKKFPYDEEDNDDNIVSITKRPTKYSVNRPTEIKSTDWIYDFHDPYKSSQPSKDWSKELLTRYKSEEDLLSLRNHDTSHPSYVPFHNSASDIEYKNILQKWKQSYLKAKYKNSHLRDYDAIGTEAEPLRVAIPKPYPIEIPHPVIVPVPQPYPVRIPIAKPVAVPVVHELTVPIEKPVPYPVYKKVPYPIEKHVPVTVEKEVTVPVIKPYPVQVPYVRPVFHHTKSIYDDSDNVEDDDYMPRPEESSNKNVNYRRKPHSSHSRTRRPSRGGYQDRNRRYSPNRRRPSVPTADNRYRRPYEEDIHVTPYKYQERDNNRLKVDDHSAYMSYCKRRGIC